MTTLIEWISTNQIEAADAGVLVIIAVAYFGWARATGRTLRR